MIDFYCLSGLCYWVAALLIFQKKNDRHVNLKPLNCSTNLHVLKLDLRSAILTFCQSPGTFLRHVARDLATWYPLPTRARENVRLAFHLTRGVRPASFWPTINNLACKLLTANVIKEGWNWRGIAHGWRGVSQDFLGRAIATVTTARVSCIEANWVMGYALSKISPSFKSWLFWLRKRTTAASQVLLWEN